MATEYVEYSGRKRPLCAIEMGPDAQATMNDAHDVNFIRRYVSHPSHGRKARTLPDSIELVVNPTEAGGWHIVVMENPDTDAPKVI